MADAEGAAPAPAAGPPGITPGGDNVDAMLEQAAAAPEASPPQTQEGKDEGRSRDRGDRDRRRDRDGRRRRSRSRDRGRDRGRSDRRRRSRSRDRGRRRRSRSGGRSRRDRSESPKRKRKKKKSSFWDMAPEQAVQAGVTKDIEGLKAGAVVNRANPGGGMGDFMQLARQARRLYVGNLPMNTQEQALRAFFNATMEAAREGNQPSEGPSVVSVYLNLPKKFAFVEFRTPEEAAQAMDLDGIVFNGEHLKMGRPTNFNASAIPTTHVKKLDVSKLGIVSTQVADGPNKVFCGGLPFELGAEQVKELVGTYGQLKAFHLVKDASTGMSRGFCFFEYRDPKVTEEAIKGLNGIQIGDRTLTVRSHSGSRNIPTAQITQENIHNYMPQATGHAPAIAAPTNVLVLLQMVTREELMDPTEYQDILADISGECKKYGVVRSIRIPQPGDPAQDQARGVGKVFVEYDTVGQACGARDALSGRTFDQRTVITTFLEPRRYQAGDFNI